MTPESQTYPFTVTDQDVNLGVVEAVAFVASKDPQEVGPLAEIIDPDALETLILEGDDVTVSFSMEGLEVDVASSGDIVVTDPKRHSSCTVPD